MHCMYMARVFLAKSSLAVWLSLSGWQASSKSVLRRWQELKCAGPHSPYALRQWYWETPAKHVTSKASPLVFTAAWKYNSCIHGRWSEEMARRLAVNSLTRAMLAETAALTASTRAFLSAMPTASWLRVTCGGKHRHWEEHAAWAWESVHMPLHFLVLLMQLLES